MALISNDLDLDLDLDPGQSRIIDDGALSSPSGRSAETIHDLRNMLAIIASGAHVLGRHGTSGELRGVIEAMQHAAQAAGQLVVRQPPIGAGPLRCGATAGPVSPRWMRLRVRPRI